MALSIAKNRHGLKLGSTIWLDHCAVEGKTRANNDFGQGHTQLVLGRKSTKHERVDTTIGTCHLLPQELQRTAMIASSENAKHNRCRFDVALQNQFDKRRRKEEIAQEKKIAIAEEDYIVAVYCFEQYFSPRCWLTVIRAREVYRDLGSEAARLAAVKEQILIRYLGLGWEEAHHDWSKDEVTFMSEELLKWLMDNVIPLANYKQMPTEPPVNLPKMPDMKELGTTSHLAEDQWKHSEEKLRLFKGNAMLEIDRREDMGEGDRWYDRQSNLPPKVGKMKGFSLEMLFNYSGDGGTQCLGWYHGVVLDVVNSKTNRVRVRWDDDCLGEHDMRITDQKLAMGNWNPKTIKKGGVEGVHN